MKTFKLKYLKLIMNHYSNNSSSSSKFILLKKSYLNEQNI